MWNWVQAAKGTTEKLHDGVSSLPAELDTNHPHHVESNMAVNKCKPVEERMWMAQFYRGRFSDLLPNMLKPANAARKKILHSGCSVATIAKFT